MMLERGRDGQPEAGWTVRRRLSALGGVLLVMVTVLAAQAPGAPAAQGGGFGADVEPAVVEKLDAEGKTDFWVHFADLPDLSGAAEIEDWTERGSHVVDRLKATASANQKNVVTDLRARAVKHRAFWAANRVLVHGGTRAVLEAVTDHAEVSRVTAPRSYELPEPEDGRKTAQVGGVEWNIADVKANAVWDEFGVRGSGVVVGSIDTGAQFDHPALAASYRGNRGGGAFDHDYNWFDPERACTPSDPKPCDGAGHGTQVLGTMVGDGGSGLHIGVAPTAKWITAKGCRELQCTDHALLASGQWMLAPTDLNGQNADPGSRPHVINNSWASPDGADTWYRDVVRAWTASGQFPVFANGSSGQNQCSSVGAPASYPESYGVGGHDPNGFTFNSGLGPSPIDGGIKPNITAPGVGVRSSTVAGKYSFYGGTSAAVAHVSGATALLLSAAPTLVGDLPAIRTALDRSAVRPDRPDFTGCGGTSNADNTRGAGRLNAFAAVRRIAGDDVGVVTGTVTDAITGEPVAGARVVADGAESDTATSASDGRYHHFLRPGDYTLMTSAFGYASRESAIVALGGETTSHDVALAPRARATVSGVVTDGSGHGWPLRAKIDISGYPGGPVFTDPVTGEYSVDLVAGGDHEFTVTAVNGGYRSTTRDVRVPAEGVRHDFALRVDPTCTAPGYRLATGMFEPFSSGKRPDGWTAVNNNADPFRPGSGDWKFDDPAGRGNLTGGSGGFATNDSDFDGPWPEKDAELVSPPVDLSGVAAPIIRFNQDAAAFSNEVFDVDLSTDDGQTWTNVWRKRGDFGTGNARGPRVEEIPIPAAAGQAAVRVRFHYYDAGWEWWWQVDNVLVGGAPCENVDGGFVVGTVTDAATGDVLRGAAVTADGDPAERVVADRQGRYTLFSTRTGSRSLRAERTGFTADAETVELVAGEIARADFALGSGHLVVAPEKLKTEAEIGTSERLSLTITNDGTEDATFQLVERDRGFTSATASEPQSVGEVRRIRVEGGTGWAGNSPAAPAGETAEPASHAVPPWEDIASYPGRVFAAAMAEHDGKVYSVAGVHYADGDNQFSNDLYVYDPAKDSWTAKADMAVGRQAPSAAFVDGKLYVIGGWDDTGKSVARLEIYDPATDSWSRGADAPAGKVGAGIAVLDDQLYFIAGCDTVYCLSKDSVFRYDAAGDRWHTLGNYPQKVSYPACGSIDGELYCAGGILSNDSPTAGTYSYDPVSDAWSPVAPLPTPLGASANAVANGQLIVAGGAGHGGWATNEAFGYDPAAGSWNPLPPASDPRFLSAGACGFYRVGGVVPSFPGPRTRWSERLPGYDQCGPSDAPWMSLDTASATVRPGDSVTVSVDVSLADADQPGTYAGAIGIREDTPHRLQPVPITVEATPPASWGKVEGTISGLGNCDTAGTPLAGATVEITGASRDFWLTTGKDGGYAVWMAASNGPVGIAAKDDGYVDARKAGVALTAGVTTTADLALRRAEGCAAVSPDRAAVTVVEGQTATAELDLRNTGAASFDVRAAETPYSLDPAARVRVAAGAGPSRLDVDAAENEPVAPIPSWFEGAPLRGGLNLYAHAQCDGDPDQVYVFGGVNAGQSAADSAWRYDAATNSWAELSAIPHDLWPRFHHRFGLSGSTAVCEAGQIHLIGGTNNFVIRDVHLVYDIATDSWTLAAPAPRVATQAASAAWNGKIYLAGGSSSSTGSPSGRVDVYDIAADSWQTLSTELPVAVAGPSIARAGQYLFLVGGKTASVHDPAQSQRLDLTTGEWSVGPPLDPRRLDAGLAATDRALYLIGGFRPGLGITDHVERLPLADWPAGEWAPFDPLPGNRSSLGGFCTQAITGGEISSVGGFDGVWVQDQTFVHGVSPEKCATIRADVGWLSVDKTKVTVAADGSTRLRVTVDAAELKPGEHHATLLLTTTDPGAPEIRVPVDVTVTEAAPPTLMLSLQDAATVGRVEVADEDIVGVNPDGIVTHVFDGSDVGLAGLAIDAFAQFDDGSLVMSFSAPGVVPGIGGTVDDSDLVRFVPESLGPDTAGVFEKWFVGARVGLKADEADVDAVDVLHDGRIVLSFRGTVKLGGNRHGPEDLVAFRPSSLGDATLGTFEPWFDGNDVGLSGSDEDVDAAAVRADGVLGLSTAGVLSVRGLTAADHDVVAFTPEQLGGKATKGAFGTAPLFAGADLGLNANDVTGVDFP